MAFRDSFGGAFATTRSLALITLLAAGCISEQARGGGDATVHEVDGGVPDGTAGDGDGAADVAPETTEPEVTTGLDGDDANVGDGSDGDPGEVVVEPQCHDDVECAEKFGSSECHAWSCQASDCVDEPTSGGDCEDGDLCTGGDFCDEGVCGGSYAIACTDLSPQCWIAQGNVCLPESGCPGSAMAEGTSCFDGVGPDGGACTDGWLAPADWCDGRGHCLDTGFLVPTGIHPLAGKWFAVISTAAPGTPQDTLRADLDLGQDGNLSADNVQASHPEWALDFDSVPGADQDIGSFCAGLEGDISLVRGSSAYLGFSDPTRSLMVFGNRSESALGVALRPTGDALDVDGAYHLVTSAHYGEGDMALMTWQGTVVFADGCIAAGGELSTTNGLGSAYRFLLDDASCFRNDGVRWRIPIVIDDDLTIPVSFTWTGAIGPGGDVLLLTRDDAQLRYGTILLVRAGDAVSRDQLAGTWSFVGLRGGVTNGGAATSDNIFEQGLIFLVSDGNQLGGSLFGGIADPIIEGGWWFTGASGRYNQRAAFGADLVHHTGFIAPNPDFLLAWVVAPPESDVDTPQALRLTPIEGSLLVAVRNQPFEVLDLPGTSGGGR